jgi:frataxin-like iron-binding protein CyaY
VAHVDALFAELSTGLASMATNPGFGLERDTDVFYINLGADFGSFVFRQDAAAAQLWLQSPISGSSYSYTYDTAQQQWVSQQDGHFLIELVARELVSHPQLMGCVQI